MTSLRGLWQDCRTWDERYQQEIDRTNGRTGSAKISQVVSGAGGDAGTSHRPADTPSSEEST